MKCYLCSGRGYVRTHPNMRYEKMVCSVCNGSGLDPRVDAEIASAVLAERRRAWDMVKGVTKYGRVGALLADFIFVKDMKDILFPDGSPKPTTEESSVDQTNPPAGDRRDE